MRREALPFTRPVARKTGAREERQKKRWEIAVDVPDLYTQLKSRYCFQICAPLSQAGEEWQFCWPSMLDKCSLTARVTRRAIHENSGYGIVNEIDNCKPQLFWSMLCCTQIEFPFYTLQEVYNSLHWSLTKDISATWCDIFWFIRCKLCKQYYAQETVMLINVFPVLILSKFSSVNQFWHKINEMGA